MSNLPMGWNNWFPRPDQGGDSAAEDELADTLGLPAGGGGAFTDLGMDAPVGVGMLPRDRPRDPRRMQIPGEDAPQFQPPGWESQRPDVQETTAEDLLRQFYTINNPAAMRRLQALLFAGGFYGQASLDDIAWGDTDDMSFQAWGAAVERAARTQSATGELTTVNDVLRDAAESAGIDVDLPTNTLLSMLEQEEEQGEIVRREGDLINISLSDPSALRSRIDEVAGQVMGRRANAGEQRMFISLMHDLERQGQEAQQTAEPGVIWEHLSPEEIEAAGTDPAAAAALEQQMGEPGDVTVEYARPDPTATAEQMLRSENPAEAGAHDIAMQHATLLEMLAGPVAFGRQTYGGAGQGGGGGF